jgi:hypothetical protein
MCCATISRNKPSTRLIGRPLRLATLMRVLKNHTTRNPARRTRSERPDWAAQQAGLCDTVVQFL